MFLKFKIENLFDTELMGKIHASYRKVCMGRRNFVEKYTGKLENLCKEHQVLEKAEALQTATLQHLKHLSEDHIGLLRIFYKIDNLHKERVQYMTSVGNHAGPLPPIAYMSGPLY